MLALRRHVRDDVHREADAPGVVDRQLELETLHHLVARRLDVAARQLDARFGDEAVRERGGQVVPASDLGVVGEQRARGVVVALGVCGPRTPELREDDGDVVRRPALRELERLLERRHASLDVAAEQPRGAVLRERRTDGIDVPGFAQQRDGLLEVAAREGILALRERGERAGGERASAKQRRAGRVEGERAIGELARLAEVAERVPEPVHRADEAERDLGAIIPADRPAGCTRGGCPARRPARRGASARSSRRRGWAPRPRSRRGSSRRSVPPAPGARRIP